MSVDLDEIDLYRKLHDLPARGAGSGAVYDVAVARMAAFAQAEQLPLTLFAVGEDLLKPRSAARIAELSRAGHAVENHSFSHRYDLSRMTPDAIDAEVAGGSHVIERLTGRRPRGFRAPGYLLSDALLDVLAGSGVAFDASLLPCPSYYLAKLLALARMRLRGRSSVAIVDSPRVALAPRVPYRPSRPWHRRGDGDLVELPVSVTRGTRLPLIGTALALAGRHGARLLARACCDSPVVSLQLHGIDFLDAGDGLEDLRGLQPDVTVAVGRKQRYLGAALDELRAHGYRFVTLDEACSRWRRSRFAAE